MCSNGKYDEKSSLNSSKNRLLRRTYFAYKFFAKLSRIWRINLYTLFAFRTHFIRSFLFRHCLRIVCSGLMTSMGLSYHKFCCWFPNIVFVVNTFLQFLETKSQNLQILSVKYVFCFWNEALSALEIHSKRSGNANNSYSPHFFRFKYLEVFHKTLLLLCKFLALIPWPPKCKSGYIILWWIILGRFSLSFMNTSIRKKNTLNMAQSKNNIQLCFLVCLGKISIK